VEAATLTVHFVRRHGAFDRITSLLRRRGFPISGTTRERTQRHDIDRMTVVVGDERAAEQVRRHLAKLPDVIEVSRSHEEGAVQREYVLLRLRCSETRSSELEECLQRHGARVLTATGDHLVIEASGRRATIDDLFEDLQSYEIEESARTHPIAIGRGENDEKRRTA
jgi:acetolactate synthase-1/3 small subunit